MFCECQCTLCLRCLLKIWAKGREFPGNCFTCRSEIQFYLPISIYDSIDADHWRQISDNSFDGVVPYYQVGAIMNEFIQRFRFDLNVLFDGIINIDCFRNDASPIVALRKKVLQSRIRFHRSPVLNQIDPWVCENGFSSLDRDKRCYVKLFCECQMILCLDCLVSTVESPASVNFRRRVLEDLDEEYERPYC